MLDLCVSYMAELERGRTGLSLKTLVKKCNILGLSADYVLFGIERDEDKVPYDRIHRIGGKNIPVLNSLIHELLT